MCALTILTYVPCCVIAPWVDSVAGPGVSEFIMDTSQGQRNDGSDSAPLAGLTSIDEVAAKRGVMGGGWVL